METSPDCLWAFSLASTGMSWVGGRNGVELAPFDVCYDAVFVKKFPHFTLFLFFFFFLFLFSPFYISLTVYPFYFFEHAWTSVDVTGLL